MKKIPNPFDWYPRDFWYWPDHDEKLLQVIHQVHDLDQVLPLIPNKRVCIQAGGACGVWPAYLAQHFDVVYTFEPASENFNCLNKNINDVNIFAAIGALADVKGVFDLNLDLPEKSNCGAVYLSCIDTNETNEACASITIDSLSKKAVDFICLDIEGCEEKALRGAAKTIERCNPVIMIEEKPLPHLKPGEHLKARQFLESIGYKEVLKVNRDVVFKRD